MGKGVPDRWEMYSEIGRPIPGTRFIAFKVPLKDAVLINLPPSVYAFGPRELMDQCPSLGLVIDLTNTKRYYDPQMFEEYDVEYEKLNTEGHVIPNWKVIQRFFSIVEKFSEENEGNDKLIGVHCTHGINRTGYLICRYLIQQLGIPPDQAISDFNSARGHNLERPNYVNDLKSAKWLSSSARPSGQFQFQFRGNSNTWDDLRQPNQFRRDSNAWDNHQRPNQFRRDSNIWDDHERPNQFRRNSNTWEDLRKPNTASEGYTPPYMPHQSRGAERSRSTNSPGFDFRRLSRSPIGRQRSDSYTTPNPKSGQSPYGRERLQQMGTLSSPPEIRGRKRGASPTDDESPAKAESFKSPKFGKVYYEQYYKGQVLPQYDVDFYNRGGGGIGPHRPQSRNIPPGQGDGNRPRTYRGPRPYRTPPKQEESNFQTPKIPEERERSGWNTEKSIRRTIFSPPGTTNDNVFSPPENEYGRRNRRFQPY